jgi:Spy/CpxP family protein refolding chaperone
MDTLTEFEKLKQKIEKQKADQKKAYLKYYENNKDIIRQKARDYKVKHKKEKQKKILTPEQQKKAEYNKRYQEKLKTKKLTPS